MSKEAKQEEIYDEKLWFYYIIQTIKLHFSDQQKRWSRWELTNVKKVRSKGQQSTRKTYRKVLANGCLF